MFGRGGAGKTTLALAVAYKLASGEIDNHKYGSIIWVSARNVDLLESGPREVSRDVGNLESIAKFVRNTLEPGDDTAPVQYLSKTLSYENGNGLLLIVDNFETVDNPKYIHDALEEMVVLPNKVLFTSRTRKLEKDYPLEVQAMDKSEAMELIKNSFKEYNIMPSNDTIAAIFESSGAIPYIMKLMVVNYFKNNGSIKSSISSTMNDEDVKNALFRTSYRNLDINSKMLFTCISKMDLDIALECAAGFLEIWNESSLADGDIYRIIDEIKSSSLMFEKTYNNGVWLSIPVDARRFASNQLENESFQVDVKPSINQFLRHMSNVLNLGNGEDMAQAIQASYATCDRANLQWLDIFVSGMVKINKLLTKSKAYGKVNRLDSFNRAEVKIALEDAVRSYPEDSELRRIFADFLKFNMNDNSGAAIQALEASDLNPSDVEMAFRASKYINDYFRSMKLAGEVVGLTLRRQLVDGIARRLQLMTTDERYQREKLFPQLFWLHVNGGQDKSALQVISHAYKLYPKNPIIKDLYNKNINSFFK